MTKFWTIHLREQRHFCSRLEQLVEQGWMLVSSGYTNDGEYRAAVWWAVLRKDTE